MSTYSINDISNSTDRHKLYILMCSPDDLSASVSFIQNQNITAINIGKQLASFIDELEDYKYLNIDVFDFVKKLLDNNKAKLDSTCNDLVAIYNLGILLEPALELNAAQLLKEFSKSAALIIIWENQNEQDDILNWPTQNRNLSFDFSDTPLKKLKYEI
jgi:hypothetical protein